MSTTFEDVDEFLSHHGILGMHWGIRKEEPSAEKKSGTESDDGHHLTETQKKVLIGVGVTFAVGLGITAAVLLKKHAVNLKEVERLNALRSTDLSEFSKQFTSRAVPNDVILPKGTEFHRVAKTLETAIDSPKYTTYKNSDVLNYRSTWSGDYKTKFSSLDTVKIASHKSQVEALARVMDKVDPSTGKTLRDQLVSSGIKTVSKDDTAGWLAYFGHQSAAYSSFDTPLYKTLISELKKNGYSGLTDTLDTGNSAEHAVVLFNNSIFKTTGSSLTQEDRDAAKKAFNLLATTVTRIL